MDKQTTLGFILIAVVLMVWMWWSSPRSSQQVRSSGQVEELKKDSSLAPKQEPEKKHAEIKTEMEAAVDFAIKAPYPVVSEVQEDVYA